MQRSSTATFGGLHQRNVDFTILAASNRVQSSLSHDATASTPTGPHTRSATTLLVTGEASDPAINTFRAAQSAQTRTQATTREELMGRSQSIACVGTGSPASTSRRRQRSDEPQMGPSVSEQVRTFRKVRDDEERDWFNKLVAIAFSMAAVALMLMILAVILRMWLNHTTIGHMMWPWGILFLACSLVLLSFCPLDEIDIDEVLQDRPLLRLSVAIAASGIQVLMGFATQPHYYYFVAALPPVGLLLPPGTNTRCLCCSIRMPSATIVLGLYLAGERFASTLARVHAAHAAGGETGTLSGIDLPGECWWALACVCVAGSLMTIGVVAFWARRQNGHMSLAVLLSKALYCHFSMIGIDGLVLGTMVQIYTTDRLVGAVLLLGGTVFVMPLLIIVFAPAKLFEMPQKRFDNDMNRAQRDGAFIAGLTDGTQVSAGQVWWIHRPDGEEDYSFEPFDHRHHWRKGRVTDTSPFDFTVEVPEGWRRLQTRRPGSADGLEKVDSAVKHVPLGARNRPWDELVKEAQKRLRCIEWKNITEELIASGGTSKDSSAAPPCNAAEAPPWQEVRSNRRLTSQIQEVMAKLAKPSEVETELRALRDSVAAETWALAAQDLAHERRQGKEMQAACIRELHELRERERILPGGLETLVSLDECKALQQVDEGTKNLVEAIVKEKMEEIVCNCVEGVDNELTGILKAKFCKGRTSTTMFKELEVTQEKNKDLEQRLKNLQGRCADMDLQRATMEDALEAAHEFSSRLEAQLAQECSRAWDLLSQLADARSEVEEQSEAARLAREEVEVLKSGDSKRPGEEPKEPPTPPTPRIAEETGSASLPLGSSSAALLEAVNKLHRRFETTCNKHKGANKVAKELIRTLRQLGVQLDMGSCAAGPTMDMLTLRISLVRHEADCLWESWLTLWMVLEDIVESTETLDAQEGAAYAKRRATEAELAARAGISRCISSAQESYQRLEALRESGQLSSSCDVVTRGNTTPESLCRAEHLSLHGEKGKCADSTRRQAASKNAVNRTKSLPPTAPATSGPKTPSHRDGHRLSVASPSPLGFSGGSIVRRAPQRSMTRAPRNL